MNGVINNTMQQLPAQHCHARQTSRVHRAVPPPAVAEVVLPWAGWAQQAGCRP
jgi:hypothetical protein